MTKFFNIDIENLITDYGLSEQNANEYFRTETKQLNNNLLKIYTQRIEETTQMSKQIVDTKNKIAEDRSKLQHIVEKVECELQTIQTENNRLESINNESRLLEVEENELKDVINLNKTELAQVSIEKKGKIKKVKREINSFKTGVNMYKTFLQMDIKIEKQEKDATINITLKNLNTNSNYIIVLEENDKKYKLLSINPRSQSTIKAAALFNQNEDIQGMLAFISDIKE